MSNDSPNYFLKTGEADRQRLTILSKLYNQNAIQFLRDSGVTKGMTVLEVGCGTGHMACDLARLVGDTGKVIAIDSSDNQIEVAKHTAHEQKIKNIEFHVCNVMDIEQLNTEYDATYGRWVVEFSSEPSKGIQKMYQCLRPGGVLAYEAANIHQTNYFSYPHHAAIDTWFQLAPKNFEKYGYGCHFAEEVAELFRHLQCKQLKTRPSQAILKTQEEKSVYRLGITAIGKSTIKNKVLTQEQIDQLHADCVAFEQSDAISGFYQNLLISAVK